MVNQNNKSLESRIELLSENISLSSIEKEANLHKLKVQNHLRIYTELFELKAPAITLYDSMCRLSQLLPSLSEEAKIWYNTMLITQDVSKDLDYIGFVKRVQEIIDDPQKLNTDFNQYIKSRS